MNTPSSTAIHEGTGSQTVQTPVEAPASTAEWAFKMAQNLKDAPRISISLTAYELGVIEDALEKSIDHENIFEEVLWLMVSINRERMGETAVKTYLATENAEVWNAS